MSRGFMTSLTNVTFRRYRQRNVATRKHGWGRATKCAIDSTESNITATQCSRTITVEYPLKSGSRRIQTLLKPHPIRLIQRQ